MTKFSVGDKLRYTGGDKYAYLADLTKGSVYEIIGMSHAGYPYFMSDANEEWSVMEYNADNFELVAEDAQQTPVPSLSPELADLLANMSRRLYEVEQVIKPKAKADEKTQADRIEVVCNEVRDLLIRKNHDYGDSFSKQFAKYGVNNAMIRMDDKMRRLETLLSGEQAQVSESIEDSIADLVGYGILTLVELRKGA